MVRRQKARGKDEIAVRLGDADARGIDRCRQTALGRGNAVLHVHGGDRQVIARLKRDRDGGCAVIRAGRAHVPHAFHAVDGRLQRKGHCRLHDLGVRAHIVAADNHLWRRELRVERDRDGRDRYGACEHDQQCAHSGEDGTADEELNHESIPAASGAEALARSAKALLSSADGRARLPAAAAGRTQSRGRPASSPTPQGSCCPPGLPASRWKDGP